MISISVLAALMVLGTSGIQSPTPVAESTIRPAQLSTEDWATIITTGRMLRFFDHSMEEPPVDEMVRHILGQLGYHECIQEDDFTERQECLASITDEELRLVRVAMIAPFLFEVKYNGDINDETE